MRINALKPSSIYKRVNLIQNKRAGYLNFSGNDVFIKNEKQVQNKPMKYDFGLSLDELQKRTSDDTLAKVYLLDENSREYLNLDEGDKKALYYLVHASREIDEVNLALNSHHNIPFRDFLNEDDSEQAHLTKILFNAQKSIFSNDFEGKKITLVKDLDKSKNKGYYPDDLKEDEFHQILIKMLKEGKQDEVQKILSQRTVVERMGDELIAIDYTEKFSEQFKNCAKYLKKASEVSTNPDFNEFLNLQAEALLNADPMFDAYADKKWASLQDTPLEFTITRESYLDEMTRTVFENPELKKLIEENEIQVFSKDELGARVGIVNKKGTDYILKVKDFLPLMAKNMPFCDQYEQVLDNNKFNQNMVDVDLVDLSGDVGSYRSQITIAENLPNRDKLSLQIGGGKRNVYHRQVRMITSEEEKRKLQEKLDSIVTPSQRNLYDRNMSHAFTIGHENAHSLGPKNNMENLGKYKAVLEENKADMASMSMLDLLVEKGLYTKEERDKIIVSSFIDRLPKANPELNQVHKARLVMQFHYFLTHGALSVSPDGFITFDTDKMVKTSRKMLEEIIKIQMSGDINEAQKYVEDNFKWDEETELIAKKLRNLSKSLNGTVISPLADKLYERE